MGTLGHVCGDLGMCGEGHRDVGTYGTQGCVGRGRRDAGMSNIGDKGGKVGGKCDISFFMKMCYLWSRLTAFDFK